MGYLIGSILLCVLGVFMGSSSYLFADAVFAYVIGTAASVSFLVGFLLLEYALYRYDFSSLFPAWGAGMAAVLALAGVTFWGEPASMGKIVFIIITLLGVSGLLFTRSKSIY